MVTVHLAFTERNLGRELGARAWFAMPVLAEELGMTASVRACRGTWNVQSVRRYALIA